MAEIAEEAGCVINVLWFNGANVAENGDYSTIYKPLTIRDALGLRFNLFFKVNSEGEFLVIAEPLSVQLATIPDPEAQVFA